MTRALAHMLMAAEHVARDRQGLVDMHRAAAMAGQHYDTFRKGWKDLVREESFPAPVRERPYLWRAVSLEAWQERREREAAARICGKPAANDTTPAPPARGRVVSQRRRMMERMGG